MVPPLHIMGKAGKCATFDLLLETAEKEAGREREREWGAFPSANCHPPRVEEDIFLCHCTVHTALPYVYSLRQSSMWEILQPNWLFNGYIP